MKTFCGEVFLDQETQNNMGSQYPISLEYYKISNNQSYGVEIVKRQYINKSINIEAMQLQDVSKDEEEINSILEVLKEYSVTPVALKDVVQDLIKQECWNK